MPFQLLHSLNFNMKFLIGLLSYFVAIFTLIIGHFLQNPNWVSDNAPPTHLPNFLISYNYGIVLL